jgi:acyl-CoA thioesterase
MTEVVPPVTDVPSLRRDTAVRPLGEGRFAAAISPEWAVPRGPNGGYVAALVLRALTAAVDDPGRPPRSLTLQYLRPPRFGDCEIAVTVEREGRSVTVLSARLLQDGQPMVAALAAFAVDFDPGLDFRSPAPDVGPPPELRAVPDDPKLPSLARRLRVAPAFGPRIFSGAEEALAGGWLRLAEPEEHDHLALALYCDAWMPAVSARARGPVAVPTMDLTIHFRASLPHPGLDPATPVLARFRTTTAAGGFLEEDGEIWAPDGTLLAQSRQLAVFLGGPR